MCQCAPVGINVLLTPEIATILFEGGAKYPGLANRAQLLDFEMALLQMQLAVEDEFERIAQSSNKTTIILHDRGAVDVAAFVPPEVWRDILAYLSKHNSKGATYTHESLLQRYDAVVHLVSKAHGAPEHYDTHKRRKEVSAA